MEPALAAKRGDPRKPGAGFLGIAPDEDDLGPGAGQPLGHGTAEFAGAADDHGNPALQTEQPAQIIG